MKKIVTYLKLIRVKHYIKNCLIFIPVFFANALTRSNVKATLFGFFAFSFMASTIYIINDIKDVNNDRLHPTKKNRPIASGEI
ncbi:MAG: UbiA family prenyltransferase, partial [Treponema sp.]|nr:UbiA family prenyltransferase [Treponema sp.]